jgi:hypothetical protein
VVRGNGVDRGDVGSPLAALRQKVAEPMSNEFGQAFRTRHHREEMVRRRPPETHVPVAPDLRRRDGDDPRSLLASQRLPHGSPNFGTHQLFVDAFDRDLDAQFADQIWEEETQRRWAISGNIIRGVSTSSGARLNRQLSPANICATVRHAAYACPEVVES